MQATAAGVSKGQSHGELDRGMTSSRKGDPCPVRYLCGGETTNNSLQILRKACPEGKLLESWKLAADPG